MTTVHQNFEVTTYKDIDIQPLVNDLKRMHITEPNIDTQLILPYSEQIGLEKYINSWQYDRTRKPGNEVDISIKKIFEKIVNNIADQKIVKNILEGFNQLDDTKLIEDIKLAIMQDKNKAEVTLAWNKRIDKAFITFLIYNANQNNKSIFPVFDQNKYFSKFNDQEIIATMEKYYSKSRTSILYLLNNINSDDVGVEKLILPEPIQNQKDDDSDTSTANIVKKILIAAAFITMALLVFSIIYITRANKKISKYKQLINKKRNRC